MKQEFEMTADEFERIKAIAQRPAIPVMKIGGVITGDEKQDDANSFWKDLGNKYGFEWDSAEGVSGKGYTFFKATPKQSQ
jgi:hypothetical protein